MWWQFVHNLCGHMNYIDLTEDHTNMAVLTEIPPTLCFISSPTRPLKNNATTVDILPLWKGHSMTFRQLTLMCGLKVILFALLRLCYNFKFRYLRSICGLKFILFTTLFSSNTIWYISGITKILLFSKYLFITYFDQLHWFYTIR